jgi:hypothetical protein
MIRLLPHSWLFSLRSLAGLSQPRLGLNQRLQFLKKRYRGLKMKFRTAKILRARRNARRKNQTTEKAIQALVIGLMLVLLLLVGCENIKHKIGISTKPFQSGEDLEDNTKINYTIVFGKVRPTEDD